jgi:hypothetical protein
MFPPLVVFRNAWRLSLNYILIFPTPMNRLVLVPIIALAAASPILVAQNVTPPSSDTQTSSENNPPPDDPPDEEECDKCKEGSEGDSDSGGGTKYKSPSEDASGKTCGEDKENDSIRYSVGLGTTLYQSKNNFVARDMGKRKPKFSKYNPPTMDVAPFLSSLSAEWKNRLTRPVVIGLATDEITDATFTPAVLEVRSGNAGTAWVKRDASGALRQILSDQYLSDITVPSSGGVLISSYLRSTVGALDSGTGLYTIPANVRKFRTVLISRPTTTGLDTVDITTTDYSSSETMPKIRGARWIKSGTGAAADWTLSHHSGQPAAQNLISSDELVKEDLGGGLTQRTRTIRKPDSNGNPVIHSVTREKYRDLGNNTLRIVERVEAPGTPEELTTTYTYTDLTGTGVIGLAGVITQPATGTTTNLLTGARLHTMQRSDGYWEEYKYQYNGGTKIMLTEKWSVWKNSNFGDKANSRHTTITLEENSRTVIEKIAGQTVSNLYEKLTLASEGTRTLREERKTGTNTAPLITERAYFPDTAAEPNKGRIQYTRHPDGTLTRYTYANMADPVTSGQTALKTTVEHGAVDEAQFTSAATGPVPALTLGTRTETITNSFEKVIDSKTWDIASGLLLEQATASAVDVLGRPLQIIHDGDAPVEDQEHPENNHAGDIETYTYACCGVKTHRARDGSITEFTKDALDRSTLTTVTLGPRITCTGYEYGSENMAGHTDPLPKTTVTRTVSAGSNNTGSLFVSDSVSDLRGHTLVGHSPDANGDGIKETTTYSHDPATRTDSTAGPDNVTATRTSYADGQFYTSVSTFGGNAITLLTTYDYAPHNLNGGGIKTIVSQFDTTLASPSLLSSISSFADLAGRTFRTESPGYNGASLVTTTAFDERGRATGQTSTGKPATLRVLSFLGEPTESWTDSNGDGEFNDTVNVDIKDSVTKTTSDYVTEDAIICRRTRQWVRDDADSDKLISTTFHSTGGLYQKTVPLAGTAPVTVTIATKPLNGNSSRTTSTAIGTGNLTQSSTITLNADGTTTTAVENKDINGILITTATQVADLQGRSVSVNDGRKPAITYSQFTPAGTPRRTTNSDGSYTITTLDNAARPTTVETYKSDTTLIATVHSTYQPDGQPAANWGTNTTPTYRKYDLQGRLKELRTYRSTNLGLNPATTTDPADATFWNYEPATGLLLSKRFSDSRGPDYTYTPDGKLLTREWVRSGTDNARVKTTYGYTPSGQLHTTDYSDNTPDVTVTFDRLGQPLTQSNGIAKSEFDYDPDTLALDTETISYNLDGQTGFEFSRVLDRRPTSLGRDTGWQLLNNNDIENQTIYTYSPTDGRLWKVSGLASSVPGFVAPEFTYTYVTGSNLIDAVDGPGHIVDNVWEPNRDVLDLKENKVGTTPVSKYDYTVNDLGQRKGVVTTFDLGSGMTANPGGTDWGYDFIGQVTSAAAPGTASDRGYLYDAIGNRRGIRNGSVGVPVDSEGVIISDEGTLEYSANLLNQYTTANGVALPQDAYDLDGNLRSGRLPANQTENSGLTWDAENRLVEVQVGTSGPLVQYAYDSLSRLIARTIGGSTEIYLYEGWNRIAEITGTTLQKTYSWGMDLSGSMQGAGGVGGLLAVKSGATIHFPTYDGNGNVSEYLTLGGRPLL